MKTLFFLLLATCTFAQKAKLQPTLGIHWTAGLDYDMEHELPSAQVGLVYTPKKASLVMSTVGVSAHYYYDFLSEIKNNQNDYYVLRLQFAKEIFEFWNFTYYAGYVNAFDNNLMKSFSGEYRSNLAYGFGIQTTDPYMTAELLFESLAGYPHLSVGVNVNVIDLLKKRK